MLTLSNRTCFCMQSDESLSICLEYVSGGSIHKLLREYGSFKEPVIRNYTGQILAGLAYLHGRNTVHRLFCCLKLSSHSIGIVI
jgi:serine/threonine protein kinase